MHFIESSHKTHISSRELHNYSIVMLWNVCKTVDKEKIMKVFWNVLYYCSFAFVGFYLAKVGHSFQTKEYWFILLSIFCISISAQMKNNEN